MKYTAAKRQAAGQRRKPPVMVDLPPPTIFDVPPKQAAPEPPDPKVIYYVRTGEYTVEIASAEDWHMLAPEVVSAESGCGDTGLEVWASDDQMAVCIFPSNNPVAISWMRQKFEQAKPDVPPYDPDDDLFAPEYHPGLTVGQAQRDFERLYKERMGQGDFHPTPDGPVITSTKEESDART